jgi:dTDP-4-dehydrorhamnose reductase
LKILIVGKTGQISWELQRCMPLLGTVLCAGRPEIDLINPDSLRQMVRAVRPDVLINAAAYTAVDQAESEPELAMKINGEAPGILAEEMKRIGGLMIHYSTDFVYDGSGTEPWVEESPTAPLNVYGAAKLAGDEAVRAVAGSYLIFRTSWVYGTRGRNFLRTVLRLAQTGEPLRIVDDQIGSPTWSRDIASATSFILARFMSHGESASKQRLSAAAEYSGTYHMTSTGYVSWCGFAGLILEEACRLGVHRGCSIQLTPISTREYRTPALRPSNSRLSSSRLQTAFGISLSDWRASLRMVIEEIALWGSLS